MAFRPYNDKRLNKAELFSLINLSIIAYTGVFFSDGNKIIKRCIILIDKQYEWLGIICTAAPYVSNVVFIIYIVTLFAKNYSRRIRKLSQKLKNFLKKNLPTSLFNIICVCISQTNSNNGKKSKRHANKFKKFQVDTLQPLDNSLNTIILEQGAQNIEEYMIPNEQPRGPSVCSKMAKKKSKRVNNHTVIITNYEQKIKYKRKINIRALSLFPILQENENLQESTHR